jgi:hypothetical protein
MVLPLENGPIPPKRGKRIRDLLNLGSGANFGLIAISSYSNCFSCGEHSSPYGGCGFGLNLKFAEAEVVFANAVEKFDAGDGDFCSSEPLEAEHGTYPAFYRSMVLFNDIVKIF